MSDLMNEFVLESFDVFESDAFKEFCYDISTLEKYRESTEWILEAVDDPKLRKGKFLHNTVSNTIEIGGKTAKAVGGVVDAKADVYHTAASIVLDICGSLVKLYKFIMGRLNDILEGSRRLAKRVAKIPADVAATIRGDIQLYITATDLQTMYNNLVINRVDTYISTLSLLTKGDTWGTIFKPNEVNKEIKLNSDDIANCKKMKSLYMDLRKVTFTKSIVRMDNAINRTLYFSNEPQIAFKDLHGKEHKASYYDLLNQLMADIGNQRSNIETLQSAFGTKLSESQVSGQWAMMSAKDQETIMEAMRNTSQVTNLLANIIKYVVVDMKTASNAIAAIEKKINKRVAKMKK